VRADSVHEIDACLFEAYSDCEEKQHRHHDTCEYGFYDCMYLFVTTNMGSAILAMDLVLYMINDLSLSFYFFTSLLIL
jgi:hypothetical protein